MASENRPIQHRMGTNLKANKTTARIQTDGFYLPFNANNTKINNQQIQSDIK